VRVTDVGVFGRIGESLICRQDDGVQVLVRDREVLVEPSSELLTQVAGSRSGRRHVRTAERGVVI
jgi:hypothetical protein